MTLQLLPDSVGDPHSQYATDTDLSGHAAAADPHTGYLQELDANYIDLTDGGATTLHTHAAPSVYRYPVDGWYVNNAVGTGGPTQLIRDGSATIDDNRQAWIAPRAGTIVGIAVHSSAARTNGTLTMTARIGGVATALTAVLDGTNTTFKASTGSVVMAAGDIIDVTYTTVGWTPTTADQRVTLEFQT